MVSKSVSVIFVLLVLFCLPQFAIAERNNSNQSFNRAKKLLLFKVYTESRQTFYCKSGFTSDKTIIHNNGYVPIKNNARANRLEWEHVVPAHAFGQSFQAWRTGHPECVTKKGKAFKGRKCAQKVSPQYRYMQADMHNLVPAIGEVNGRRSNYSFAMIPGEVRSFGTCDMEISNRKAEPPEDVRGDIARTYFYMEDAYPGHGIISKKNHKLFKTWDKQDPVSNWECEREARIHRLQDNSNRFVKRACPN